jgi:hypothetical protein
MELQLDLFFVSNCFVVETGVSASSASASYKMSFAELGRTRSELAPPDGAAGKSFCLFPLPLGLPTNSGTNEEAGNLSASGPLIFWLLFGGRFARSGKSLARLTA